MSTPIGGARFGGREPFTVSRLLGPTNNHYSIWLRAKPTSSVSRRRQMTNVGSPYAGK